MGFDDEDFRKAEKATRIANSTSKPAIRSW